MKDIITAHVTLFGLNIDITKTSIIPASPGIARLSKADRPQSDAEISEMCDTSYREVVGGVTWVATMIRPDLRIVRKEDRQGWGGGQVQMPYKTHASNAIQYPRGLRLACYALGGNFVPENRFRLLH